LKQYATLILLSTGFIMANNIQHYSAEATIGYEEWKLPKGEKLGVVRLGALFNITPWWYGGLDFYGAVKGKRGGFFTFGFDSGLQTSPKEPLQLRGGLFVGAGGGGAAPQGGGLMVRPYGELRYKSKNFAISGGISHVRFPNGGIKSTQLFTALYIPFSGNFWSGWQQKLINSKVKNSGIEVENFMQAGEYIVSKSSHTTNGKKLENMKLVGTEFRRHYENGLFTSLSTAGASGGNSDGYMEVFGGLGYRQQLAGLPIFATAQAELGMGGGGKVNTGGGTMWRVRSGLEAHIAKHYVLGINGGYVKSFQGDFKAKSIIAYAGLTHRWGGSTPNFKPEFFSVRALQKTHFSGKGDFKDPNRSDRIDMLGVAFDHYFNQYFYATGQALWAYKGNSGGYTEGLMGIGVQSKSWHGAKLWGEALIGAGGGGGVKTSGGVLTSATLGLSVEVNNSLDLLAGIGYTKSTNKGLSSTDATFGFRYRFALPKF